ncbi:hypothetical protein F5Y18DRAFT_308071 [Xylariaceae sp. FL1019]|nr:hypothetical protein F5Y18DRAFT_308071 [Xylariaceae sp. FL1019]
MFGTLRIGSSKDSVEFIEHAKGEAASSLGGYVFSHSACERCRLKKLRCNKHRSGCDRCKDQGLDCSYQPAAKTSSSRPRSQLHSQTSSSDNRRSSGPGNTPRPRDDRGVSRETGGWSMDEADSTGSLAGTSPQSAQDQYLMDQSEVSNLEDLHPGLTFDGELGYSEHQFDSVFSNIGDLQPDIFTGIADRDLLSAEGFSSMTETAGAVLDGMGEIATCQPASAGAQPPFMTFDHARTLPSSPSHQTSDASASDRSVAVSLGRARSRVDPSSCPCQNSILNVLAEIESNILSASPSNMYATLSYQRRTTAASNSILTSRICNCKMELFGLLEIIGGKITSLSEAIITAFVHSVEEQTNSGNLKEPSSLDRRLYRNSAIRLGEFQVQTLQEFKVVSAAAIKLQLKYSVIFVSRTRALALSMDRLVQAQNLKTLESRLEELLVKMQRMISDMESDCCNT